MNRLVGKDPKRFGLKRLVSAPVEVTGAIGESKGFSVGNVGNDILPKKYALCVIFMILVSLENVKKCTLGGCTIT